jgi:uncharacterized protein (DUF58 family)
VRLTPLGRGVLAGAALLLAGWRLGWVELTVLGTGCAAALVVSLLWVAAQPRLQVSRQVAPNRVPRGSPALGVLRVSNPDRRPSPRLTAIERVGAEERPVEIPRLAPGKRRTVTYRLPTERRGVIEVGPLLLTRTDPFGLLRRGQRRDERATLFVHPATQPLAPLPSGQSLHLEGPTADTAPNGSITFHALREYVVGDDLRHIHWRSSARLGTLMVRQHVDASLPHSTVVLDTRADRYAHDPAGESFEVAVDVAASIVVAASRHSFPVRLLTTGGLSLEAKGGRADAALFLDRLATVTTGDGDGGLAATLELARQRRVRGSLAVVTGCADGADLALIAPLQRRFDRVVVVRVGPPGSLPPAGLPAATTIDAPDLRTFAAAWHHRVAR